MVETTLVSPSQAVLDVIGSPNACNWAVNIDPAGGFVYMENPKVACSTIKATLNLGIAARDGLALSYSAMRDVHDRKLNPMVDPGFLGEARFDALMTARDVFRFTYLRDPVKRLCSAYLSKIKGKTLNTKWEGRQLAAALEMDGEQPISLESFVDLVTSDDAVRDFNPHWRLQREQVAFDHVDFSFIGRHETLQESFPNLIARLFPDQQVAIFDSRHAFGRKTNASLVAQDLPAALRARIEASYAPDFEMLEQVEKTFDRAP